MAKLVQTGFKVKHNDHQLKLQLHLFYWSFLDAVQDVTSSAVQAVEAVQTPEAVEAPRAVPTLVPQPEAVKKQVVNNGSAVMEEHVEEFDWASVASFLQGTPEPGM